MVSFKFPMAVGTGGAIAQDESSASALRLLCSVCVTQWIGRADFGFPAYVFEQASLGMDVRRSLVLASIKQAVTKFVPGCVIVGLELRKTSSEKRMVLDITYLDSSSFSRPQRVIVGLYTGEEYNAAV